MLKKTFCLNLQTSQLSNLFLPAPLKILSLHPESLNSIQKGQEGGATILNNALEVS